MLAFLNLGLTEMVVVLVVSIIVFGRNLPTVAVQAAATVQKMRRSLSDLRRDAGIDEELRRARREIEQAIPRDLPKIIERKLTDVVDLEAGKPDAAAGGTDSTGRPEAAEPAE